MLFLSLRAFFYRYFSFALTEGAHLKLSRRSTPLSTFSHFLPKKLWVDLANSTSNYILEKLSKKDVDASKNRYLVKKVYEYGSFLLFPSL